VATALLLADLEVEIGEGNNHDETESNPEPFSDLKRIFICAKARKTNVGEENWEKKRNVIHDHGLNSPVRVSNPCKSQCLVDKEATRRDDGDRESCESNHGDNSLLKLVKKICSSNFISLRN
jgi:hypothetical protein